jgi:hypothetical protein
VLHANGAIDAALVDERAGFALQILQRPTVVGAPQDRVSTRHVALGEAHRVFFGATYRVFLSNEIDDRPICFVVFNTQSPHA